MLVLLTSHDLFVVMEQGIKTIDTRANTPKYQDVQIGDILIFQSINTGKQLQREVIDIRHYETIEDIFKNEDFRKIMPGVKTPEEAQKVYYSFPNYEEKITTYGIVTFELKEVNTEGDKLL